MLKQYDTLVHEVLEDIFEVIRSNDKQLDEVVKQYFLNGGKRVRVLLLLMCAKLGNFELNKKDIIRMASIVEIIHTASLIHDDIIDNADTRRGSVTMNKMYSNEFALRVGDYLFSVVLKEVAKFDNEKIHLYLSQTLKELCIGELIQEDGLYNVKTRKLDYLKKIKRKTAILIAFACVVGSIVADASDEDIRSAFSYGYYLGMSYQIVDDYLDFVGGAQNLGKEVGQDLMNGNITLPALLAKEENPELFYNFTKDTSSKEKGKIINYIKNNDKILLETLTVSRRYLEKAQNSIDNIDSIVKNELIFIMNKLARREN